MRIDKERNEGFTLIEIMIVVLILGLIIALLIPVFQGAMQKSKQKSTMKDINSISTAITDYIIDKGNVPTNADDLQTGDAIITELSPYYLKAMPLTDHWGYAFRIYTGSAINGQYGISMPAGTDEFIVSSLGKAGVVEGWSWDPSSPDAGFFKVSSMLDFRNDLVCWNGSWVRAPYADNSGT